MVTTAVGAAGGAAPAVGAAAMPTRMSSVMSSAAGRGVVGWRDTYLMGRVPGARW